MFDSAYPDEFTIKCSVPGGQPSTSGIHPPDPTRANGSWRRLRRKRVPVHARISGALAGMVILIYLLTGCAGTTHHFLPPRPLENHEVMISWTWNYDLDNWNIPTLSPALNVYASAGSHVNIGAGFQFVGITHLTFVRYSDINESTERFLYAHLNQFAGTTHNNPYFEIGFGQASASGGISHVISAGLSVGHGMSYGMIGIMPREISQRNDSRDFTHIWRLMPTIKYAAMGRDISASLSYYYGKSRLIHDNIVNAFVNYNDTVLSIPADMIDSLGSAGDAVHPMYAGPAIFLKNDSVIYLWSEYYDDFNLDLMSTWGPFLGTMHDIDKCYAGNKRFFGNQEDVIDAIKSGKNVVITKYPNNYLGKLRNPKGLWRDLSFGFGAMQLE